MTLVLRDRAISAAAIKAVVQPARMLVMPSEVDPADDVADAFAAVYPKFDRRRWFLNHPLVEDGRTYLISKMWGRNTEPTLAAVADAFSDIVTVKASLRFPAGRCRVTTAWNPPRP